MTNKQDETNETNKIIIDGVIYSPEELRKLYAELSKPIPAAPHEPRVSIGKGLQFITDQNLYKEIVDYMDKTFPAHKETLSGKLSFDGVMKGSSPYLAVAVDMFLRSQKSKHKIATQRDLETNLQMFKGCYEDTGLALRSVADPNKSQAKHLYKQIKQANPSIEFPIFIELRNLDLDASLNFKLTPQSQYKKADCLNWESGTHYSQADDYGLPKSEDKSSGRQIWTMKDGLVRACLYRSLCFGAGNGVLPNSYDDGRVVLVSAEGSAM